MSTSWAELDTDSQGKNFKPNLMISFGTKLCVVQLLYKFMKEAVIDTDSEFL